MHYNDTQVPGDAKAVYSLLQGLLLLGVLIIITAVKPPADQVGVRGPPVGLSALLLLGTHCNLGCSHYVIPQLTVFQCKSC